MRRWRIVARRRAILMHEVNDLVLSFSGDIRTTEEHFNVRPSRVLLEFLANVKMKLLVEFMHELCACRNRVVLHAFSFGKESAVSQRFPEISPWLCTLESTSSLLILFRTRARSIQKEIEHLAWFDETHHFVDVVEYEREDLFNVALEQ